MPRQLHIALIGTRGVPSNYGGFETCVEQLGQRLVQRGHTVTVYCRSQYNEYPSNTYKGMRLVKLPTILNKYLDTIVHTALSVLHALFQRFDVAICFNVGNSPLVWVPRLVGTKVILNVDGLDWKRDKWPPAAKLYIQFAESLATRLPNVFITDSTVVQAYYQERYNHVPEVIAYGSDVENIPPGDLHTKYGLEPGQFVLFVGRLVEENSVHHLIEAFKQARTDMRCVIVGSALYADGYIRALQESARDDDRIVFTGYIFGKGYHELGSNAYLFVGTSGVGGTHPALTEALGFGQCVIAHDTPENRETVGEAGLYYDGEQGASSLLPVLQHLIDHPEEVEEKRQIAHERAHAVYSWDTITEQYEALCFDVLD